MYVSMFHIVVLKIKPQYIYACSYNINRTYIYVYIYI